MESREKQINRRSFIRGGAAFAGGLGAMIAAGNSSLFGAVPPSDKITVGFIGVGARAQQIMDSMIQIPGLEIVNVCDAYTGRVKRAISRANGRPKAVEDYRRILQDKSVDAVVIATPDHWHKQMAIEAVEAGKDVYIEKPLTYNVDEGIEIINAVKASDRVFQVGSQGISSGIQQKARDVIGSGKLGQITMIRAYFNRNTAGGAWIYPIPPDANRSTVDWEKFLGPAPQRAFDLPRFFRWRCYQDYSGGIATDLFVHLCTTIHYLMDVPAPVQVMGMGDLYRWKTSRDVPDSINASLKYREGFMVNMSGTFNNTMTSGSGFQVLGTEGSLEIGGRLTFHPETPVENDRWVVRSWEKSLDDAYYADPKMIEYEEKARARSAARKPEVIMSGGEGDSTKAHLEHWVGCIKNRNTPLENAEVGHRACSVAHMVNMSIASGNSMWWDFERDNIRKW
ncbi:MAG: Gfo/Idh/MocA family oxidoreductase [Candidatus Glassbacteria bacterium]|nr:Gfo/Idh/MocA family oxidoreductase [Candidatus Glassbacteria bacterium]